VDPEVICVVCTTLDLLPDTLAANAPTSYITTARCALVRRYIVFRLQSVPNAVARLITN